MPDETHNLSLPAAQKIIDCHTHAFPDKIAPKIIESNRALGFEPFGTGTMSDLARQIAGTRIAFCVVVAVATLPRLVEPANRWLLQNKKQNMVGFGTIHPDFKNYKDEIRFIRKTGAKGVKFSSLFQNFSPDEDRLYPIYEVLVDEQMPVLFHAGGGMDRRAPEKIQASPKRLRKVLDDFPAIKMIVAHWGGFQALKDAQKYLWGQNVYLDTSYPPGLKSLSEERLIELIDSHGASRILFGSDFPFGDQHDDIRRIQHLPISSEIKHRIFFQNAANLLGIEPE
jgi:predicted TIM-barrel fold metal-dependent hydrolase